MNGIVQLMFNNGGQWVCDYRCKICYTHGGPNPGWDVGQCITRYRTVLSCGKTEGQVEGYARSCGKTRGQLLSYQITY